MLSFGHWLSKRIVPAKACSSFNPFHYHRVSRNSKSYSRIFPYHSVLKLDLVEFETLTAMPPTNVGDEVPLRLTKNGSYIEVTKTLWEVHGMCKQPEQSLVSIVQSAKAAKKVSEPVARVEMFKSTAGNGARD